jgi:hypothetical protein
MDLATRRQHDTIVIGAGIAGLSMARALARGGARPVVLERARGVGGRCATRRIEGCPVDFGLPFLHGRDPRFLEALSSVSDATPLPGWPVQRHGRGVPCQPEAFEGEDHLLAFREGLTRFPKHLARGLDVRLQSRVVALELAPARDAAPGRIVVRLEQGEPMSAPAVVVTLPAVQAARLIEPVAAGSERLRAVLPLLAQIRMLPCLTAIAGYGNAVPRPPWDVFYPDTTTMVHSVLHDSSKRPDDAPLFLAVQGRPGFSREYLDASPETWGRELLWETGEFLGNWVERPGVVQYHRWTHARCDRSSELAAPLAPRLENGAVLGFCGDGFSAAGGAEGAYLSGLALAGQLLATHCAAREPRDHPTHNQA